MDTIKDPEKVCGKDKFYKFASKHKFLRDRKGFPYCVCAVRRNKKRSICEAMSVYRLSDRKNKKAIWDRKLGWIEKGWLIALNGKIKFKSKKSNFKVYPLAKKS